MSDNISSIIYKNYEQAYTIAYILLKEDALVEKVLGQAIESAKLSDFDWQEQGVSIQFLAKVVGLARRAGKKTSLAKSKKAMERPTNEQALERYKLQGLIDILGKEEVLLAYLHYELRLQGTTLSKLIGTSMGQVNKKNLQIDRFLTNLFDLNWHEALSAIFKEFYVTIPEIDPIKIKKYIANREEIQVAIAMKQPVIKRMVIFFSVAFIITVLAGYALQYNRNRPSKDQEVEVTAHHDPVKPDAQVIAAEPSEDANESGDAPQVEFVTVHSSNQTTNNESFTFGQENYAMTFSQIKMTPNRLTFHLEVDNPFWEDTMSRVVRVYSSSNNPVGIIYMDDRKPMQVDYNFRIFSGDEDEKTSLGSEVPKSSDVMNLIFEFFSLPRESGHLEVFEVLRTDPEGTIEVPLPIDRSNIVPTKVVPINKRLELAGGSLVLKDLLLDTDAIRIRTAMVGEDPSKQIKIDRFQLVFEGDQRVQVAYDSQMSYYYYQVPDECFIPSDAYGSLDMTQVTFDSLLLQDFTYSLGLEEEAFTLPDSDQAVVVEAYGVPITFTRIKGAQSINYLVEYERVDGFVFDNIIINDLMGETPYIDSSYGPNVRRQTISFYGLPDQASYEIRLINPKVFKHLDEVILK